MQNKRPICLLDVIYKLLAKILANRLSNVMHKIIHVNQTGFMKNRFIGENVRLITDVIEYCSMDDIEGLLLAIDYRNAFDTLEHDFLWFTLKSFNFGTGFCSWIKLLYSGALLSVCNNGYTSEWFPCTSGTFQGSPLSGMLFKLAVEMLANRIRLNEQIRGITISNVEIKLTQYADDTTLFVNNAESGKHAISLINDFSAVSGLRMNMRKTKCMWLGAGKHKRCSIQGIEAVDKIKILGVWFSATARCTDDNMEPVISKIKYVINSWSQRNLTIKGRITITKSLLASQVVYLALTSQIPKVTVQEIQSKIMKFLWRGRPPKVAATVLCQNIEEGGLKAIDVAQFIDALKLTWVKRVFLQTNAPWRQILQARMPLIQINDVLMCNRAESFIKQLKIPLFYKNVMIKFQSLFCDLVDDDKKARLQKLWFNDEVKMNGKTVMIKGMYEAGITDFDDLLTANGVTMSLSQFKRKYPNVLGVNFLNYYGLIRAIPMSWKKLVKGKTLEAGPREKNDWCIQMGTRRISIRNLRSQDIYVSLLPKRTPAAVSKWRSEGFENIEWRNVFKQPYSCCTSTKLQSLHYRIVHRYIPTRKYLCIRGIVGSPLCRDCFEVDTLQHFFFYCSKTYHICHTLLEQLKTLCKLPTDFVKVDTVLFGYYDAPKVVNLILLIYKQYIITCKIAENMSRPCMEALLTIIKNFHDTERIAAVQTKTLEKFRNKWEEIVDENGELRLGIQSSDDCI